MSIQSELDRITGNIAEAYTKVSAKGGTLPAAQNSDNLPDAIDSIPSGGGGKNIQYSNRISRITNKTEYTATSVSITVEKSGTYNCAWMHYSSAASTLYYLTRLYVNDSPVGETHSTPTYNAMTFSVPKEAGLSLEAGDVITVYARTRSGASYFTVAGLLVIEEV